MDDGPLTVNFLNAIVPDTPMAATPPGAEQTAPGPQAQSPGAEHGDRTTPEERSGPERHTPAPVVTAPISQAAPPPAGQQPPSAAPQSSTSDGGQRSPSSERNGGGRPSQGTGDTRATDPSANRSLHEGDGLQVATESAPPAPETGTTSDTAGQDTPATSADEQRANPHTTPAPEQETSPADIPLPPSPVTESGPPQDTEDTGHSPSGRDGERPDEHGEGTSGNDDRSQDRDRDRPGEGGDQAGDGERSGEENGDRSGDGEDRGDGSDRGNGEDDKDREHTDGDTESVYEEESAAEEEDREQGGEEPVEDTPAGTSAPLEQETPRDPPSVETGETAEEVVRTPTSAGSEAPVITEEARPEDREPEDGAPPAPPPQEDTDTTPASTETERPRPDTGDTRQREEPPPRNYPGSVTLDPAGTPYDLGYLLTSSLVNSSMVHAEHLRSFVDDTLANDAGHVDATVRDAVRERVDAQAREQTGVFFQPEGFSTTVAGADGSTWRADLRLSSSREGFHHAPTKPKEGSASTELKLVDEAGEANPAEGSGNHGGTKFVGLGFQVSPLLLGTVGGADIGPRFTVSFSGGTRQRQTVDTVVGVHDGYTSYEIKGKPEVYASDLTMSFDLTPVHVPPGRGPAGGTAPANGGTPPDDNASDDNTPPDQAVSARAESSNGVVLVLPGGVVANTGPETIRLRDPFATEDHQRGRNDDDRPVGPHADKGHPVSVGDIRLSDGSSDRPFPDWIADHLWSPEQDRGWWRSAVDKVTPGFVDRRRQQELDAFRDQVGELFSKKSIRNNLPKMTSAPAVFTVTDPSGRPRLVSVQSVPTAYDAKPHTIQPAKYVKGNKVERESGSSLRHSDFLGVTLGAGVSVDAGAVGGTHKARVDAMAVEGGVRSRSTAESAQVSSGSVNRMNYGKTESSAYDVQRNYYVHFDGEPGVYRFQGDTVEILTVQEARILNGDEPSDKVSAPPAPGRTEGGDATPGTVNTPEAAHDTTGDQRPGDDGDRSTPGGDERNGGAGTGERNQQQERGPEQEQPPGERPSEERPPGNEQNETLRPPRPNLAEDHPVTFHGAVPRDFTWPDGGQYRDVDGQQRSIYQQIAHEVLTGLADRLPGLVLPDMARDPKNFARRPGHENSGPFTGSTREHRPFRRDHETAVFNTHRVMDAISASEFRSGMDGLTLHGQPVHLIDTGRFDPGALFKRGQKVVRSPFVALRVSADFSALRHVGETTRGTGGEYAGASERTTADGSQKRRTVRFSSGGYVRRIDAVDAADNPSDGGVFSVSLQMSDTKGKSRGLGTKSQSERTIQYAEDSSVWNAAVRFRARLYEEDDLGMVLGGNTPLADRGQDLLDRPIEALATMDTAKAVPERGGQNDTAPRATRIRPIPVDQARAMIDGPTRPTPARVRRTRDVTGGVRRFFGGGRSQRPPVERVPVPAPEDSTGQRSTGSRSSGDQRTPVPGTSQPNTETAPDTTGQRSTETTQAPNTETAQDTTGQQNTTENAPDTRPVEQRRAEKLRVTPAVVENVNTRFSTGDGNQVGSLLEAAYESFSSTAPWERGEGVQRPSRGLGYERKLRHFLRRGEGSRQFYEKAFSPESFTDNPAARSSGGARTRTEMSGALLSPHHLRATSSTRFDIDSVDRFEQSDGAVVFKGKNTLEVFSRDGRRTDLVFQATGGGRVNPNPVHPSGQPAGGAAPAPNSASAPLIQLGPSAGKSLFDRYTITKPTSRFNESVEFHPKIPMSYSYSASGRVTQAMEFVKNWSIGPTFSHAARYRGWQADSDNLESGLIHIRDAHASGMVEDKVQEIDGELVRFPQPEPERPASVRPRPGFEDSGMMLDPVDPDEALQSLVDDLASQGWQLTKGSREIILKALESHTGLNPNTGMPVTVKISPIDHSIGNLNSPTSEPLSLDATVKLRLDRENTEVEYLGGRTEYRRRQGSEEGDRLQQGSGSSTSTGAHGSLLTPLPQSGGEQPGGTTPPSRPYLMGLRGDGSTTNARGDGGIVRDTGKRSVQLTMETPYARVSSDTRLTLDLHISEKQGAANSLLGEDPGSGGRRDFTGTGNSGPAQELYPAFSLDLRGGEGAPRGNGAPRTSTDGDGTANRRPGGQRTGNRTAPENPSNDHHASLTDMARSLTRAMDPRSRAAFENTLPMLASVGDKGRDVLDLARIVLAKSWGWNPPAGSVRDGRYTPEAVEQAADHVAAKLKLNSRNNAIDQTLTELGIRASFTEAVSETGAELPELGPTTWMMRAIPHPGTARVIDYNPSMRLTDSSETSRTFSPFHSESSTTTTGFDARPSGRTGTGPPTTATHYGSANNTGASTSGGDTARGSKPKEPPHSDRVRTGPGYLVEMDTEVFIGARTELRGPWYKRSARYVGDRAASAGRAVRGVFGGRSTPSPAPSRPARWQQGGTTVRTTQWISHGDAVRMGVITPGAATDLAPLTKHFTKIQKALADAEKAYLEARRPLDQASSDLIASPGDQQVQDRYVDLETTYEERLEAFNRATRNWLTALQELREGLDDISSLPRPRTAATPDLHTIPEEPPSPPAPAPAPQRNAPDPAADPEAVELSERSNRQRGRGTGQRNTGPGFLDTLGSDVNIQQPESGEYVPRNEEEQRRLARSRLQQSLTVGPFDEYGTTRHEMDLPDDRTGRDFLRQPGTDDPPGPSTLRRPGGSVTPGEDGNTPFRHGTDLPDDRDTSGEEEELHVRWLDRQHPEASSWDRETRSRAARWHLNRWMSLGPSSQDEDGLFLDGTTPLDGSTGRGSHQEPRPGAPAGPSTSPSAPQQQDRPGPDQRPRPAPSEDAALAPRTTDTTGDHDQQPSPDQTGTGPGPGDRPQSRATTRPTRPAPEATPTTRPPARNQGDAPQQEGAAPPVEQPPPSPDPEFDLAAFFDQALNGPADNPGDDPAQGTTRTSPDGETTPEPPPAVEDRGQETSDHAPAPEGAAPLRERPEHEGEVPPKDPEHTRDEKDEEDGTEEESEDAPTGTEDEREDGDGDDGGSDKDRSGGNGGGRSDGDGGSGQDRSGGGSGHSGSSGGSDRSRDRSGDGDGSEGDGKDRGTGGNGDRSSHGDARSGGDTRNNQAPDHRDTAPDADDAGPVPDLIPDTGSDAYDSDDDLAPHDLTDTPVRRPRRSPFDEPLVRPLWDRDGSPFGSVDTKSSARGNDSPDPLGPKPSAYDFLGLLNSGSDQPLPSSVTDFLVMPVFGGNGRSGNPQGDPPRNPWGDNQAPPNAPTGAAGRGGNGRPRGRGGRSGDAPVPGRGGRGDAPPPRGRGHDTPLGARAGRGGPAPASGPARPPAQSSGTRQAPVTGGVNQPPAGAVPRPSVWGGDTSRTLFGDSKQTPPTPPAPRTVPKDAPQDPTPPDGGSGTTDNRPSIFDFRDSPARDHRFARDPNEGRIIGYIPGPSVRERDAAGNITEIDVPQGANEPPRRMSLEDYQKELLDRRSLAIASITRPSSDSRRVTTREDELKTHGLSLLEQADIGERSGAVHAVVIDRRTGAVAEGINGDMDSRIPTAKIHDIIKQRMNEMKKDGGYRSYNKKGEPVGRPRDYPMKDSPVRHAEIKAINALLNAKSRPEMAHFQIDTVFTLRESERGRDFCPCCANCTRLTYGAPAPRTGKNVHLPNDPRYNKEFTEPVVPDWTPPENDPPRNKPPKKK
ncbi:YwqJ-related putative deaminase [Nocardiopsis halotolerans]|uniref:YwqJ-related putative deaminase n=1 Tax=Nocardiopsis halotolerans TaxID=124252 RepID=UPI00034B8533|nr:YwqJ-related putative deaminase [Nocardiopsis halotolerans]